MNERVQFELYSLTWRLQARIDALRRYADRAEVIRSRMESQYFEGYHRAEAISYHRQARHFELVLRDLVAIIQGAQND